MYGKIYFFLFILICRASFADSIEFVEGKNFKVPVTQDIHFVPLKKLENHHFNKFPRMLDLKMHQSEVKSQGLRGACTYFVITGLVESLIKKSTGQEIDLSEEYLAWAAKTKKKLRSEEEDSSVAANAATIQDFGIMLEKDLPYQPSWFEKGLPCEGQKQKKSLDPICFAHAGPKSEQKSKIISGSSFEFRDIGSSSLDIVRELSQSNNPVTISILAHAKMWDESAQSGDLFLTATSKKLCQNKPKSCTGHAALIVGYDLDKKIFFLKNSWGKEWGQLGYGTIPFDYIDQMSSRRLLTGRLIGSPPKFL